MGALDPMWSDDGVSMPRVALVLPTATYRAADFVEAAATVGAEVVVVSEEPPALAQEMADGSLVVDFSRPEEAASAIVDLGARTPLDAVVAVDDQGVLVAALAAQRLGLSHNPPGAVAATRDKGMMREMLARFGVAQPEYRIVGPADDVRALVNEIGFPCVVKPVGLSASRGVIRANDQKSAAAAAAKVRAILEDEGSGSDPILVESYMPGAEVAVEGLVERGRLRVLAVFDKPDPLEGPFFEETIYVTPSRLAEEQLARIEDVTAKAISAIGLREGPVHAELRVDGLSIKLLEVAARPIGGLCSRSLRFGLLGTSLEEAILRHALGKPVGSLRPESAASGVMMIPIPKPGVLREVRGQGAACGVPLVVGLEITIPRGRRVVPLPEGDRYLGFLFAKGDRPEAVEAALREAHSVLDVVIE
jgi:biotin carboxylase